MTLRVRTARLPEEAERLAHADWRAFRLGTPEHWISYYQENDFLLHDDGVVLAEDDGDIVGMVGMLRLAVGVAGADVPCAGVAAVGVQPEHRRQGIADRLMREALVRARKRGLPISILYPFSVAYYRRFGYELCERVDLLRLRPRQLPPSPLARRVRRFVAERDAADVEAFYERWRQGKTGPFARSRWWWDARVYKRSPERLVFREDGEVTGFMGWDVPAEPAYPRQNLFVNDFLCATPAAARAFYGFLAAQGEQIERVEAYVPHGHALALLVEHASNEREPGTRAHIGAYQATAAMARLVDVAAAFAAHPGPARAGVRGKLGLDLGDPVFPDQSRGFDVSFGARGARVVPGTSARQRLTLDVQRLAQIYFAAVPARELLALGLVAGDARAAALLDAAFAGPPLFLSAGNYF